MGKRPYEHFMKANGSLTVTIKNGQTMVDAHHVGKAEMLLAAASTVNLIMATSHLDRETALELVRETLGYLQSKQLITGPLEKG